MFKFFDKTDRFPPLPERMFDPMPKTYEVAIWSKGWVILENKHSWGVFFDHYDEAISTMRTILNALGEVDNGTAS